MNLKLRNSTDFADEVQMKSEHSSVVISNKRIRKTKEEIKRNFVCEHPGCIKSYGFANEVHKLTQSTLQAQTY